MTTPLVVTAEDIANSLGVCGSTYRSFCTVSRPLGLPFSRLPGAHKKALRGYHLQPVIDWLRAAASERMGEAVEGQLYAKATANQARINKKSEAFK